MSTDLVHDVLLNNHVFHCRPFDLIYRNYNNTDLEYDQLVYCDTNPNMYKVLAMRRGLFGMVPIQCGTSRPQILISTTTLLLEYRWAV